MIDSLPVSARGVATQVIAGVREIFGDRLLGIYAYGSAVVGDFDPGVSDLDLTAVLTGEATELDLKILRDFHDQLAANNPGWEHRVEVQYIARDALTTFRGQRNRMINISPGEPIHFIDTGIEWLANWYFIVDHGLVLFGLPTSRTFPAISGDEFVSFARDHARDWLARLDELDGSQAQSYAILTNCRALYTHRTGQQVSKIRAATWVSEEFPHWKDAIIDAIAWRIRPQFDTPETASRARHMIETIVAIIEREHPSLAG